MMHLTPIMREFIVHWGKMGARWGINRTVAQIYAQLYLSPRPLNAEEISETLSVARSTVSTGLHELQGWNLVKLVQVLGDRRDHFEAVSDVWEMMRTIVDELGGRGFALYIAGVLSRDEAQDLLRSLGASDANPEDRRGRDPS